MTDAKVSLHWSAAVGAACSYWLIFWLFLIGASLYDISSGEGDFAGLWTTVGFAGLFAVWAAYQGKRRLDLLKNGVICTGETEIITESSHDFDTGITGKIKYKRYRYRVNGETHTNTLIFSTALIGRDRLEIVYHAHNPGRSLPLRLLRARFDRAANQWQSSMNQAMPRLILLIAMAVLILAALSRGVNLP